jgi:MFS family permease
MLARFKGQRASLAPLSERAFRLLWLGQTTSSAGNALVEVAFVFAILHVHGTVTDIGCIFAIQAAAGLAFLLAGGVWADRMRRQIVMLGSDAVRAVVEAVLAVLLITGHARIWELGLGAAVFGMAASFFAPAATGLVTEIVNRDQLLRANGLLSFSTSLVGIGGLAIAGALVAAIGPAPVLAIDAATFVVSAISLGLLRLEPRRAPEHGSFLRDLAEGWHEVAMRPWYWLNMTAHALGNFGFAAYFVLGPVIAAHDLGGARAWGAIAAAQAAGASIGGIIALRCTPGRPLVAGNLALGLATLPLLALARPMPTWTIALAAALGGAGMVFLGSVWAATMQSLIPEQALSRVDAYDWLVSLSVMPAGMALVGPIAGRIGDATTLVGAALLAGLPCALIVLVPGVRRVRTTADGKITGPPLREAVGPA